MSAPTPRRRVLVVAGWYPSPEAPLAGIFVRDHALAAARRHDVAVLVVEAQHAGHVLATADGVEHGLRTLRIRHRALPGPASGALYVPAALRALRRLERSGFRPEVIHAHTYATGLLGVLLGRRQRVPVVVSEHFSTVQLGTLGTIDSVIARAAYRGAATVSPVSAALSDAVAAYAPHARLRVVPNVVDTELFRPPERPAPAGGDLRLLYVGSLEDVKGVDVLLRALALSRERGRRLLLDLVGDGSRRSAHERLAADLGLGSAATFHGAVPKADVAAWMRAADALVVPSRTETFGVVVVEAMASGLPVIATRAGALSELVDARVGTLVAAEDPAALAEGLSGAQPRANGERAVLADEARRRFGPDTIAEAWSAVYEEVLAAG